MSNIYANLEWGCILKKKREEILNNMQMLKLWYTWVHVDCRMFRAVRLVEPERRFKEGASSRGCVTYSTFRQQFLSPFQSLKCDTVL